MCTLVARGESSSWQWKPFIASLLEKKYLGQQALTHTSPFTLRNGQTEMPSNINENVAYKKDGGGVE